MLVEITKMNKEEVAIVTSLDIAETFGKEHRHVLRDIRELECSEEFRLSNFGQSSWDALVKRLYVSKRRIDASSMRWKRH